MSDLGPITRGMIVWAPALFSPKRRPFLIVSNDAVPFDEDHIAIPISRSDLADSVPIEDDDWLSGGLPEQSYVKPWNVTTLQPDMIRRIAGTVRDERVDVVVEKLNQFLWL